MESKTWNVQSLIIFNNMLNNERFPNKCKVTKVVPILKKRKDPKLLPNLGKDFGTLINKSITHHTELNKVVPNEQFDLVKSSRTHAITKFSSDASVFPEQKQLFSGLPNRFRKRV